MNEEGIEYKYFRVVSEYTKNNIKELNTLLEQGWTPVRECAFGGYSNTSSILVLLMRKMKKSDVVLTEVIDELTTKHSEQVWQEPPQEEESPGMYSQRFGLPLISEFGPLG